jgi:hypothetical protein
MYVFVAVGVITLFLTAMTTFQLLEEFKYDETVIAGQQSKIEILPLQSNIFDRLLEEAYMYLLSALDLMDAIRIVSTDSTIGIM